MTKQSDPESAAAQLYRLAQAHRLLRLYREGTLGEEPELRDMDPAPEDYRAVEQAHPDLARRADLYDPYLNGRN
jgi:hypothetical protein